MGSINQMTYNTLIQSTLFVAQNNLFVNQITQHLLRRLVRRLKKIINCALGEHDPGHLMMGEHQAKCRALSSTTLNFSGVCLLSII